jgi:membrane-associated protein
MTSLFDAIRILTSPERIIQFLSPLFTSWLGYALLFAIVFSETGLLVGFFLPGDSLMFLIGTVAGAGNLDLFTVNVVLMVAAIAGDTFGYMLGRQTGPKIFSRPNSRWFRREHLDRTHAFYEKYGGKTIIYARFVPIVRTFAPFVAGVGKMEYARFISFNVFGGIGWVLSMTMLGYLLGGIPIVKQNLEKAVLLVILLSIAPIVIEAIKASRKPAASEE